MSGSKKTVTFEAADKAKGSENKIPTSVAPSAVSMAGGKDGAERTQAQFQALPLRDRDATDEQFPTDALTKSDPRDEIMTAKLQLQQDPTTKASTPGITPFGVLTASDSDFEWLRQKRDTEAEANFQQWFASNFDKMGPEQKAVARKLWPKFYEERLALLDKDLDLLRRLARQNITGIETKQDLLLQYAKEAGYIDTDRLNNLMHPEKAMYAQNKTVRQALFKRGLLNPRRKPHGHNNYARDLNAKDMENRTAIPFAAKLGVGTDGFNVQGVKNYGDEQKAQNWGLLGNLPV